MNKPFPLIMAVLFAAFLWLSGCSGSGDIDTPHGASNAGEPALLELVPSQYIVRTDGNIKMQAKVIDGNGQPVKGATVSFTKIGGVGTLSAGSTVTKEDGTATVSLTSSSTGYATIEAETASSRVFDRKVVFFNGEVAGPNVLLIDVDGDDAPGCMDTYDRCFNGHPSGSCGWNEMSDFDVFEHDLLRLRATLKTNMDAAVPNQTINFYTDFPYKLTFYDKTGNPVTSVTTDTFGQAIIYLKSDAILREKVSTGWFNWGVFTDYFNVWAYDSSGAADTITLFLDPVRVSQVIWHGIPDSMTVGDPWTIVIEEEVFALISAEFQTMDAHGDAYPVPDGTVVKFAYGYSTTCNCNTDAPLCTSPSAFSPFFTIGGCDIVYASTSFGRASFLPDSSPITPSAAGNFVICAFADGMRSSRTIPVVAALTVTATTANTVTGLPNPDANTADDVSFSITGGLAPYTVTSSNVPVIAGQTVAGTTFTVDPQAVCTPTTVTLTVTDSLGGSAIATVTVNAGPAITILPASANICENDNLCPAGTETQVFTVSNGVPPFTLVSDTPGVIAGGSVLSPFTVDAIDSSITVDTTVILNVTDSIGCTTTVPASVTVTNQ